MSAGAAAGAAAAAAIAEAIKASGVLVRVEPKEFERILARSEAPLVVHAYSGFWKKHHQYLTGYKGLAFFTASPDPVPLPEDAEVVESRAVSIPG